MIDERVEVALKELVDELERLSQYSPDIVHVGWKFVNRIRREEKTGGGRTPEDLVAVIGRVRGAAAEHRKDTQEWFEKYGDLWPEMSPEAKAKWEG